MKRFLLIAVLLFSAVTFSYAQESAAKRAFTVGDYSAAVELYQAAIATAGTNSALSSGLDTAKKCASLKKKADAAYSNGSYRTAQQNYQAILKLNPSDSYVRGRISKCTQLQAAAEAKAAEAKKSQPELDAALAAGTPEALRAFAQKFPKDSHSKMFLDYSNILGRKGHTILTPSDVEVCRSMGKILKSPACDVALDMAISYCDLEAMYVKATTKLEQTKSSSDIVWMMNLLKLSSVGGYEPAKAAYENYLKKDWRESAGIDFSKILDILKNCDKQTSKALDGLTICNDLGFISDKSVLNRRIRTFLMSVDAVLSTCGDNQLYWAQVDLNSSDGLKKMMLRIAAQKGNKDAILALSLLPGQSKTDKAILNAIYKNEEGYGLGNTGFKEYVKYLKGGIPNIQGIAYSWLYSTTCTSLSDCMQLFGENDPERIMRHEWLYISCVIFNERYGRYGNGFYYDGIVTVLKKYSDKTWDRDLVRKCINLMPAEGKYAKKARKKLNALVTKPYLYDISENPMKAYALNGYFDNTPHSAVPTDAVNISRALRKVASMTSSASSTGDEKKSATSGTASATTKSTSSTTTKTTASTPLSTKPEPKRYTSYSQYAKYKVGDMIGDAIVYTVDRYGIHGTMVKEQAYQAVGVSEKLEELNSSWRYGVSNIKWRVSSTNEFRQLRALGYITVVEQKERKHVAYYFRWRNFPELIESFVIHDVMKRYLYYPKDNEVLYKKETGYVDSSQYVLLVATF